MTKGKTIDKQTVNRMIIEIAEFNDWISKKELSQKLNKPYQTITNYLNIKDICELLEQKDTKGYVNRNTGKSKTLIKKYKLKSDLDTLLNIFNYLDDKNCIAEFMYSEYYSNLIIDIKNKIINNLKSTTEKYISLDIIVKHSPSAVWLILKLDFTEIISLLDSIKEILPNPNIELDDYFFFMLNGVFYADIFEGYAFGINSFKSQTYE